MKNKHFFARHRTALEIGGALGFLLAVVFTVALAQYDTACNAVCADTLRLHILANSDAPADQALKLQVRDAVLADLAPLLQGAANKPQAVQTVRTALPMVKQVAQRTLRAAGSNQSVTVTLEQAPFAAKQYAGFRLPGGEYTALRIALGDAAGHNWFCVLYPALCLGGSGATYHKPAENAIVFQDYELRLMVLDSARELLLRRRG